MNHRRITCLFAVIMFFTGLFTFVVERVDARAGGGHRFSGGGSRSYSSSRSRSYSSSRSNGYSSSSSGNYSNNYSSEDDSEDTPKFDRNNPFEVFLLVLACFVVLGKVLGPVICSLFENIKNKLSGIKFPSLSFDSRPAGPYFNRIEAPKEFIERVKKAFIQIQEGWSKNDLNKCEAFLSDGTYEQFQIQINEMIANTVYDVMDNLTIKDAFVTRIEKNASYESAYIVISAKARNYRYNYKTGEVIDGDYFAQPFTEIWCFMRRTGAKTVNEKGLIEGFCPNCGAPIEGSRLSKCPSCNSMLRSGEHDWVLTSITQASEWLYGKNDQISGLDILLSDDPDFNVQNMEDKLSAIFWRMAEANRINSANPIRKIATNEFIERFEKDSISSAAFPKLSEPAIGSIGIFTVKKQDDFYKLYGRITWSGTDNKGESDYRKSFFVLKRGAFCKTDSDKNFTSTHCPNCGAPQGISDDNLCEYCKTAVNDIEKDWLLDDIVYLTDREQSILLYGGQQSRKQYSKGKPDKYGIDYSDLKQISDSDLLRITVAMMLADGVISQREKHVIYEMFNERACFKNIKKETERATKALQKQSDPIVYAIESSVIPNNLSILKCLIRIAAADGKISDEEIDLLNKVAAKMKVSEKVLRDLINIAYENNWNKK